MPSLALLELGNSTCKLSVAVDGTIGPVERFSTLDALVARLDSLALQIICAPVNERVRPELESRFARSISFIDRAHFASFIGDTYDTPQTLGLDRLLNLYGCSGDAVVISCGTAITIDAVVDGTPRWGAIMPGFTTATEGLHERVPVLPAIAITTPPRLPARTTNHSLANGVLLATAHGALAVARMLADITTPIVLTGGDAEVMLALWRDVATATVDEMLLFRGMARAAK